MPILLESIDTAAAQINTVAEAGKARTIKAVTPKFFSSSLTGQGKKQGVLNSTVVPGRYPMGLSRTTMGSTDIRYKERRTSNNVTSHIIPIGTAHMSRDTATCWFPSPLRRTHSPCA